jgi:hypothetical protein
MCLNLMVMSPAFDFPRSLSRQSSRRLKVCFCPRGFAFCFVRKSFDIQNLHFVKSVSKEYRLFQSCLFYFYSCSF